MADPQVEKSNNMDDEIESESASLSFAHRLDCLASTLSKNERLILATVIFNLLDPIERMKWRRIASLLEPNEIEILNKLESEWARK
jgi:hypothetical protein